MKVLILCDRESDEGAEPGLLAQVETAAARAGRAVRTAVLNGDEIAPCVGCFSCWVKTPGLCAVTNDCVNGLSREMMRSDALVLLSRIRYGGYSRDVKAFLDRAIPNILPFFEIYRGKMHHAMRYKKFPRLVTVGYGESTGDERETFRELARRNALNLRPPRYDCLIAQDTGEYADVLSALDRILSEAEV